MDKSRLEPRDQRSRDRRPSGGGSTRSGGGSAAGPDAGTGTGKTGGKFMPSSNMRSRNPRKLILCFDGTGNKFHGDDSDSNILKIFRMLDRESEDQYHYYQPGIGTYVVSSSLSHTGLGARINSWYQKAKDSAIGSSFDSHVVGGYEFLMRFYNPGDEIYMFGFSRGAYIARFLAEMLDYVGLLSHGNEEMVKFAWKAFAQWQSRSQPSGSDQDKAKAEKEKEKMYNFMKGFRETFSRPVGRIQFLGLFDTVNSVPRFETAWMQRSRFPYTARSSAKVIRHAVSIDERRAKFRQDLIYQNNPKTKHHRHAHLGEIFDQMDPLNYFHEGGEKDAAAKPATQDDKAPNGAQNGKRASNAGFLAPQNADETRGRGEDGKYGRYRSRSRSRQDDRPVSRDQSDTASNISMLDPSEIDENWDEDGQDIDEVWFSGGHGDVGGGWEALNDRKSASHVPLTWMVREARKAGLPFDTEKVKEMGCWYESRKESEAGNIPRVQIAEGDNAPTALPASPDLGNETQAPAHPTPFHELMHKTHDARIHDSLEFGSGLPFGAVLAWKIMEHIPFRRMDLQADGSWIPIRWPLPRGEVRDIPENVRVHGSVLRRMDLDHKYRPGNLIIGGGGRGVRRAPEQYGKGEWICVNEPGDPIGEIWTRRPKPETSPAQKTTA